MVGKYSSYGFADPFTHFGIIDAACAVVMIEGAKCCPIADAVRLCFQAVDCSLRACA